MKTLAAVYVVLGATWAFWSRVTCERLRVFSSFWPQRGSPGAETLVKALAVVSPRSGRNMGLLRTETLVKALSFFISFWAQHVPPGAETLVKTLAVFISFWAQHGPPEGRDTCEHLSVV